MGLNVRRVFDWLLKVGLCGVRDYKQLIFNLALILFDATMLIFSTLPALRIAFVTTSIYSFTQLSGFVMQR